MKITGRRCRASAACFCGDSAQRSLGFSTVFLSFLFFLCVCVFLSFFLFFSGVRVTVRAGASLSLFLSFSQLSLSLSLFRSHLRPRG